jgi:glycosyltransferase involved in cell wall biosynthesis
MRILQISSAKNFGGGERHLIDLINGLSARGHKVFLAAPETSPLREKLAHLPSVSFVPVDISHALDIFAARKLSRLIKGKNIDIVHAHVARDYLPVSLAIRFAASSKAAKLVLTRHVLFPMKRLQKFALANVSKVIAVSHSVEKQLRRQKVFLPEKIVTVPNGIEIEHWSDTSDNVGEDFRKRFAIPIDVPLIGTVGELKKLKGQEDFILAAEIVLRRFPAAHFVSVGKNNSGDKNYLTHLKKMVAAIGAEQNFIWIDHVEDTAPLLKALDIFVSASHSESFGLAILEAMSSACTVVATETEGAKELLGNTSMTPVGDPVKLSEKIVGLLDNDAERTESARKLQIRAKENFSLEKMIASTEELYLQLKSSR